VANLLCLATAVAKEMVRTNAQYAALEELRFDCKTRWNVMQSSRSRSHKKVANSVFMLVRILNGFFDVADIFLQLACHLFFKPFGLLFFATHQLACALLGFASDVFGGTLDLILVHDLTPPGKLKSIQ